MMSSRSFRQGASEYADDARTLASQAIGSTRDFANQAFDRAGDRMRDLRSNVRDIASRSASSMGDYAQATQRYVAEEPVKSALIAAAIGAALAGLVLAMRRGSVRRRYD
jgi:ElaB/YqjD/DUF883 family membrane-anchored ribosome-binding protein